VLAAALLALAVTNGAIVAAQTPPNPRNGRLGGRGARPDAPPPPAQSAAALNDVQQMLDAMVLGRAQPQLQLSNDQYPQFFKSMQALQQLRRQHQMRRQRMLGELRRLINPQQAEPPDDATLAAKTKELDDLETQMFQDEQKSRASIDAILTPHQRARFRVFEENMEREKLRMLAKALADPGKATTSTTPIKK
jgi:Spy/CpxP family protein refolding chaperone